MLMTFFIGLTGYATALVAQYLGAGRKGHCELVLSQAVFLSFLATPDPGGFRPLAHDLFAVRTSRRSSSSSRSSISTFSSTERSLVLLRNCLSSFSPASARPGGDVLRPDGDAGQRRCQLRADFRPPRLPRPGNPRGGLRHLFGSLCGLLVLLAAYLAPTNRREFEWLCHATMAR